MATPTGAGDPLMENKCPNCGAPLPLPGTGGTVTCSYCGTTFTERRTAPAAPPPPPPVITNWYPTTVPSHAVYSRPVARPKWPGILFMIIFLTIFILPVFIQLASVPTYSNHYSSPTPPTVSVYPASSTGYSPLTVAFSATVNGGSPPYSYYWDFGDGYVSTQASPTHTFTVSGTYEVSLSVTDSQSESSTGYSSVVVR